MYVHTSILFSFQVGSVCKSSVKINATVRNTDQITEIKTF